MILDVVGKVPPPYGGVTVHTGRLASYVGVRGCQVRIFDFSKRKEFSYTKNVIVIPFRLRSLFSLLCSRNMIHFHGGPWWLWCMFGLLGFTGRKVIFGVHASSWLITSFEKANGLKKWLFKLCCCGVTCFVVPHVWVHSYVRRLGLPIKRIERIHSFVAPIRKSKDYLAVFKETSNFVAHHNPVLGGYAYRLNFKDGVDVYGLDLLLSLLSHLKVVYPKVGLIVVMPEPGDLNYFEELKHRIQKIGLNDAVLFIHGEKEAYPVWEAVDVFVRPTVTDADALTIRECLCVAVPVVASDCIERPQGVVTFRSRDLYDLERKVKMVLSDLNKFRIKNSSCSASQFLTLYKTLEG